MSDNFSNYDAQALEFLSSTDVFELEETTTNELPDFSIIENANSSKIKSSDERFRDVKFDDIDNFLKENENENTCSGHIWCKLEKKPKSKIFLPSP